MSSGRKYDGRMFWEKASKTQLLGCIADLEHRKKNTGQLSPRGEQMLANCKKALNKRWSTGRVRKMQPQRRKASLGKNQLRFLKYIREHGSYNIGMGKRPFACWSYIYQSIEGCLRTGLISKQDIDGRESYILTMEGSDLLNIYVGVPTE